MQFAKPTCKLIGFLLILYFIFTSRIVPIGPSRRCNFDIRSRRQLFTLFGAEVETIARFFLSAFSSALYDTTSTTVRCDSTFGPGSFLNFELGVGYLRRDEKMSWTPPHIPESRHVPAHPEGDHTVIAWCSAWCSYFSCGSVFVSFWPETSLSCLAFGASGLTQADLQ